MKKLFVSTIALAAVVSAASAFAADLPSRKAPPYIPPPPPPLWTGFYVGLNAGGTFGGNNSTTLSTGSIFLDPLPGLIAVAPAFAAAAGATGVFPSSNGGGFIGGGQIGYNWQFNNSFVTGIEADIQGVAGNNSSATSATGVPVPLGLGGWGIPNMAALQTINVTKRLDYIGTVRGRIGWLFTPTLLAYATGGLAYGGVESRTSISGAPILSPFPFGGWFGSSSFSDTRVGWTVGGGLEWMFWPNWSAKVEYLYYDLGNVTYSTPYSSAAPISVTGIGFTNATQSTTRFDGHIVRAGVNYHFNWGPAPVVAKY